LCGLDSICDAKEMEEDVFNIIQVFKKEFHLFVAYARNYSSKY